MLPTYASVYEKEGAPKYGCHESVPRVSQSHLLPLWGTLQDEQIGLAVSYQIIAFALGLVCVRFLCIL